MRNYWYVSLTNKYPQPNADDPIRVVRSVQIKKNAKFLKDRLDLDVKGLGVGGIFKV